jgi:hypothetical protein
VSRGRKRFLGGKVPGGGKGGGTEKRKGDTTTGNGMKRNSSVCNLLPNDVTLPIEWSPWLGLALGSIISGSNWRTT